MSRLYYERAYIAGRDITFYNTDFSGDTVIPATIEGISERDCRKGFRRDMNSMVPRGMGGWRKVPQKGILMVEGTDLCDCKIIYDKLPKHTDKCDEHGGTHIRYKVLTREELALNKLMR